MNPPPALPAPGASALELFLALVQVPSPSGTEGQVASAIESWLDGCPGVECVRDDAAAVTGSDTGNLIARRFVGEDRPTVLFVTHVDTVQAPGELISPEVDADGVVWSGGGTILGADNKAAVAAVLSVLARPSGDHANVIVAFTTSEERGRMGVVALEPLAGEVDYAFPVDGSYPIGTVLESALGQVPFTLTVRGRRAHAAKAYADGVNAVQAACEIVAGMELGWVGDSVLNISALDGGSETNLVPDLAVLRGEARAFSAQPLAARLDVVRARAAAVAEARGVSWELTELAQDGAPPFPPAEAVGCLEIVSAACDVVGLPLVREQCMATLEANFLSGFGMATLGIASGGRRPHSVDESLVAEDLERLVALLDAVLGVAAGA